MYPQPDFRKQQLQQALDRAIQDESQAINEYNRLATDLQAWVNTLPPQQRLLYQGMVNDIRFIQSDETRHRTVLQGVRGRLL